MRRTRNLWTRVSPRKPEFSALANGLNWWLVALKVAPHSCPRHVDEQEPSDPGAGGALQCFTSRKIHKIPGCVDGDDRYPPHPAPVAAAKPSDCSGSQRCGEDDKGRGCSFAVRNEFSVAMRVQRPERVEESARQEQRDGGIGCHSRAEDEEYADREETAWAAGLEAGHRSLSFLSSRLPVNPSPKP